MYPRHRAGVRIASRNQEQCLAQSAAGKAGAALTSFLCPGWLTSFLSPSSLSDRRSGHVAVAPCLWKLMVIT